MPEKLKIEDDEEKAMVEAAEAYEQAEAKKEEARVALEKFKLSRALENEKYRLLDESIFPLTKSGSKFVTIGVSPLNKYVPTIKIHNKELTAAA
ncbi:hypothetical protein TcasGA2_TC011577 [Tribolium castaneum]|uniref:Uncharacterized protein n=1 Tax=Tribolium castaneum TaxID=7070 RepID=D7GY47_TRICA|nr:hypothetical protein TcasGA2_TC011577 [Tribolium castaneum]